MKTGPIYVESNVSSITLRGKKISTGERTATKQEENLLFKWIHSSTGYVSASERLTADSEIIVKLKKGGQTRFNLLPEKDTIEVSTSEYLV